MSLNNLGYFTFGNWDSREAGIIVKDFDTLTPPKRSRKVTIPGRSGKHDFGSTLYDERVISLQCQMQKQLTRAEIREIAYILSEKKHLVLSVEPDKYYIAEIYDAAELNTLAYEIMHEFTLTFVAEPFAYGAVTEDAIHNGRNVVAYIGTAPAPCEIIIENPNNYAVSNITITATRKG